MKKVALTVVFSLFCVSAAFAAGTAHMNTGCGLGTVLWKNKADGSIMSQSLQATTNGTFGNQTFGITSGTSECSEPAKVAQNERLNYFVLANMDNLAKDIAVGHGEALETYAELLGIPAGQRQGFYAALQANFGRIFTSEHATLADVVDNTIAVTSSN